VVVVQSKRHREDVVKSLNGVYLFRLHFFCVYFFGFVCLAPDCLDSVLVGGIHAWGLFVSVIHAQLALFMRGLFRWGLFVWGGDD